MSMMHSLLRPGQKAHSHILIFHILILHISRSVFVRFIAEHKQGESLEDSPSKSVPSGQFPPSAPLSPAVQSCLDQVLHSVKGGHVQGGAVLVMLLR